MSHISKPSRKLLESLDNAALNDGSSASDSSSDSEFSSSGSSSSSKCSDKVLTTSNPCNEDDHSSSGEDQPSPKWHKGLGGTVSRVKKTWGLGKKNKTAGELACMCQTSHLSLMSHIALPETAKRSITYNLSMFLTVQMAKPKKKMWQPQEWLFPTWWRWGVGHHESTSYGEDWSLQLSAMMSMKSPLLSLITPLSQCPWMAMINISIW